MCQCAGGGQACLCQPGEIASLPLGEFIWKELPGREGGFVSPQLQPQQLLSPVPLQELAVPREEEAGQLQCSPACVVGSMSWEGNSAPPNWGWESLVDTALMKKKMETYWRR